MGGAWTVQHPPWHMLAALPRRVWQPAALHAARQRLHAGVCAGERVGRRHVPGVGVWLSVGQEPSTRLSQASAGWPAGGCGGLATPLSLPMVGGLTHAAQWARTTTRRSRSKTFRTTCARGSRCATPRITPGCCRGAPWFWVGHLAASNLSACGMRPPWLDLPCLSVANLLFKPCRLSRRRRSGGRRRRRRRTCTRW